MVPQSFGCSKRVFTKKRGFLGIPGKRYRTIRDCGAARKVMQYVQNLLTCVLEGSAREALAT